MQNKVVKELGINHNLESTAVIRLTALWAFSESALGGLLHMFRIPFTGAIISSVAAILIIMIASFSVKKGTVLKATILVIAVKAAAAPYTPVNAFVSVLFQGIIGEWILSSKKFFSVKAVVFSSLALLQSAIQRIVVLTVMMGMTLWESIDVFGGVLLKKMGIEYHSFLLSWFLVAGYILLYLVIGVIVGIVGSKIPKRVRKIMANGKITQITSDIHSDDKPNIKNRMRNRYKIRVLPLLLIIALIGSYFISEISFWGKNVLIMTLRYFIIMALWTFWAGPFLLEKGKKVLNKHSYKYKDDIDFLIKLLPKIRTIAIAQWKISSGCKGIKRIVTFCELLFSYIIAVEKL